MAKKDLSKRDRELFERLRAKGIGKKLARRIASAPDVDGGGGGKRAKRAAKKAVRRHEERWTEAEQRVMAAAQSVEDAVDEDEAVTPVAGEATGEASLGASPAGGPLREAVQAAGALPHLGVGPGSDLSGVSSAEVPVVPTDQLPEHAGATGGDGAQEETVDVASATADEEPGEQQGASAAIEEPAEGGEEGAGDDERGEVAAETPPTGEGDRDEDLTSGLTAGGMDLGAVAPAEGGETEGSASEAAPLDEVEAAEPSAEDAEGGQEAQGGTDGEADLQPDAGGGARDEG